ncbi:MAG: hypothetical protein ABI333_20060 [bacterium]
MGCTSSWACWGFSSCSRWFSGEPTFGEWYTAAPIIRSFNRLKTRLPLLEKLVAANKVRPAVLRRVLVTTEQDLADFVQARRYDDDRFKHLKTAFDRTVKDMKRNIARIRGRLKR